MANERFVALGNAAIEAGTPDNNDLLTNATDAIANILHAVARSHGPEDVGEVLGRAFEHFADEQIRSEEMR